LYFLKKVTPVVGNVTLYTGNELGCDGDLGDFFHKVISIIELCFLQITGERQTSRSRLLN